MSLFLRLNLRAPKPLSSGEARLHSRLCLFEGRLLAREEARRDHLFAEGQRVWVLIVFLHMCAEHDVVHPFCLGTTSPHCAF